MSEPQDQPAQSAHRSRWRRFSPSMGWRAFWSEIVIVVLGVAIALVANEAVQDWTWRNKVKDAEARLQGDIAWAFLWAAEKYVSRPCVDAQLMALSRNVLESMATLEPVPVLTANHLSLSYVAGARPSRRDTVNFISTFKCHNMIHMPKPSVEATKRTQAKRVPNVGGIGS